MLTSDTGPFLVFVKATSQKVHTRTKLAVLENQLRAADARSEELEAWTEAEIARLKGEARKAGQISKRLLQENKELAHELKATETAKTNLEVRTNSTALALQS